jgi:hypothetical protein
MAFVEYAVQLNVGSLQDWFPTSTGHPFPGNILYCATHPGTGDYNFTGFFASTNGFLFFSAPTIPIIDPADTINSVTIKWHSWNPTFTPNDQILLVNNVTQTTWNTTSSPTTFTHTMLLHPSIGTPGPWDLGNLSSTTFGTVILAPVRGDNRMDYAAFLVDYTPFTPPPTDAFVMVWTAGAYPSGCGQPPIKRFKPFKLFDSASGLAQAVTDQYLLTYGKPPPGYVIWCYWRTVSYDLIPRESSPITTFTITPWPPPG